MTSASRRNVLAGSASFLAGLAAGSIPTAKAAEVAQGVDPIFPAIERNLAIWEDHRRACIATDTVSAKFGALSPEADAAQAAQDVMCSAHNKSLDDLLEVVPTTLAGVAAYIDFLGHVAAFEGVGMEAWQMETVLATLGTAIRSIEQD